MTGPAFTDPPAMQPQPRADGHAAVCGGRLKQPKADGRTTCNQPAGWDTPHPGTGRCSRHGGATPSHVKAAERQEAVTLLGTLGVVADPASLPTLVVYAELELSAAKQLAAVRWLERQVGDLRPEQVDVSPWPPMLRDARRDSDRLLVELAKLGLDARRVQLEERQVDLVEQVLAVALGLLGLSAQAPEVRAAVAAAARQVEGEVA